MRLLNKIKREVCVGLSRMSNLTVSTNYNGLKLRFPILRGMGKDYYSARDEWMEICLRVFLQLKSGCILDVGTNIGILLVNLKCIEKEREYYGYEPNPVCVFYCQELVRLNNFKSSQVYTVALSNKYNTASFFVNTIGDKGGTLLDRFRNRDRELYSEYNTLTNTGDSMVGLSNMNQIAMIKIDVEGAELEVLEGFQNTLQKNRPFVYCEMLNSSSRNGSLINESEERNEKVFNILNGLDYIPIGFVDNNRVEIIKSPENSGNINENYIFTPKEDCDSVLESINKLLKKD